jgi:hypothetical protein
MQRGTRQKLDGNGQDWVSKRRRRTFRLADRSGVGKATKRAMARRRRRALIDADRG